MSGPRVGQHNFSKGILSKELWGRVDIAPYAAGVREAKNVLILKYGGLTKRPGSRMVYEIKDGPKRLIPFEGAYEASYAMLLGQATMRLGALGGMVLEEKLTVEALTPGETTEIHATFHGYEVGDEVFFSDVDGMIEINGLTGTVTAVADADHFTVEIDSSGFSAFTGDEGGVIREAPPTPPPPPPPVPPPAPPPPPPGTGGGGGGGGFCVVDDTPILMKGGANRAARLVKAGHMVHTQARDGNGSWGDYLVSSIEMAWRPVFKAEGYPRATAEHRFWIDGAWVRMDAIGEPDGEAWVAKITVAGANTYVAAGILSHNKLANPDF